MAMGLHFYTLGRLLYPKPAVPPTLAGFAHRNGYGVLAAVGSIATAAADFNLSKRLAKGIPIVAAREDSSGRKEKWGKRDKRPKTPAGRAWSLSRTEVRVAEEPLDGEAVPGDDEGQGRQPCLCACAGKNAEDAQHEAERSQFRREERFPLTFERLEQAKDSGKPGVLSIDPRFAGKALSEAWVKAEIEKRKDQDRYGLKVVSVEEAK